jgi:SAP domain
LGTKIERQVPSEVIQGAFISGALVSLLAGQGIISSVTGLAALSSAYLAITPGKGGDAARGLGGLTFKSANLMANLYSQLLPFLQLASQNQNTLTGNGKEQSKNRLIELEKLETEMNSVLAEVEIAVTKAEADLSRKDETILATEDKEENQDKDQIQNANVTNQTFENSSLSSIVGDEPETMDNASNNVMVETNMNFSESGNLTVQDINQAVADEILISTTEYGVKDVNEETSEEQMDKTVIDNVVHSQSTMHQVVNHEDTLSSLNFEESITIGILDDKIPGETFPKSVDLNEELKILATKNATNDEAVAVLPELIVSDGIKSQILETIDIKDEDTNNLGVIDSKGTEMFESHESIDIDDMNITQVILAGEAPDVLQKDDIMLNQDIVSQNVETNVKEPISVELNTQESDALEINPMIDVEVTNSILDQVAIDILESEVDEINDVWESKLIESFVLMDGDSMVETIEKDGMDIKEPEAIENNNMLGDKILNESIDVGVVCVKESEKGTQDTIINEIVIGSLDQMLPDIRDPEKFQSSSSIDEGNVENAIESLASVTLTESMEEQPIETGKSQTRTTKQKVDTKTKSTQAYVAIASEIMSGLSEMPTIDERDNIKDLEASDNLSMVTDIQSDEINDLVTEATKKSNSSSKKQAEQNGGVINSLNLSPDQEEISTTIMDTNVVSDPVSINIELETYDSVEEIGDTYEMEKDADMLSLQQQLLIFKEEIPSITEVTKKGKRSTKRKTKGDSLASELKSEKSLIEARQKQPSKSKKSYTRKDKDKIVEIISKGLENKDELLDLASPKKDDDQEFKTEMLTFVAAEDTDTDTLAKNEESERDSSMGEMLYPESNDGIITDVGNQPVQPLEQVFSPIDDDDVLNMSPEELAAQAKSARIAVELFESQRYNDSGSGMLTDENMKGEWIVESEMEASVTLQKEEINTKSSTVESTQENVNDSIIRPVAFMSGKMQAFNINGDVSGAVLDLGQEMSGETEEFVSKIQKTESVEERLTFVSQLPKEGLTKSKKTVRKKKQMDAKKSGEKKSSTDSSEDLSLPMKSKDDQPMASTPLAVKQTSDVVINKEASEIQMRSDENSVGRWNDAISGDINFVDERERWVPSPYDENDDLDMTSEELAAQARAARLAVEIFESQRVQEVDFRDTLDRPEKYDWNLEFDDDEPSDQDLLEIDSEMSGENFGEVDDVLSFNSKRFINIDVNDVSQEINVVGQLKTSSSDWTTMKVADLRKELSNRGLKTTGTKAMLIAALEKAESDAPQGQVKNDKYLDGSEEWGIVNKLELHADQVSSDTIQKDGPTSEELLSSFEAMTIAQLRKELKLRGLKTTGKKVDLVQRLMAVETSLD